ncbi:peptidylprolyl isomerase [Novipirellula galeiformis]|uniref:peptidylprolyl isomerase n=1 Tax=Novipirellula galeiformis TaxID=2528004 RepID=UPI0011B59F92|nr:peptidylprolyl isomerase [Novipirellula galeiformis]
MPTPPTSATVGTTTLVAIAAPAPASPSCTLPEFLGINQVIGGTAGLLRLLRDRITARLGGRFPGLEPKPPLLALTDPANLSPDAPASVQAAAKVKQQKDAAAQKAKAAEYLATVGCGCYEGVAEALAANLTDCSEEVRYATVKALRAVAQQDCCSCGKNSCCTLEVHQGLSRLAWDVDSTGCFVETSSRVRRTARLALEHCCVPIGNPDERYDHLPAEGPELEEGELLSKASRAIGELVRHAAEPNSVTSQVLVRVNGEPILAEEILATVEQRFVESGESIQSASDKRLQSLMDEVLEQAIDRKVLAQTARIVLSVAVRERLQEQSTFPLGNPIGQVAYDETTLNARFELSLAEELLRRQVDHDALVDQAAVTTWYQQHAELYRAPDQIRWQQFSVNASEVGDSDLATEFLAYAKLAATGFRSEPPTGYDERYVHRKTFDFMTLNDVAFPAIRDSLESLKPGQASEIMTSPLGASFVLVNEIRLSPPKPLEDVTRQVKMDILEDRRKAAETAYIAQLRTQARIQYAGDEPAEPEVPGKLDVPAELKVIKPVVDSESTESKILSQSQGGSGPETAQL